MKKIIIAFVAIIFIYSCSQKTTSATTSTAKPAKPTEAVVKTVEATTATDVPVAVLKEKVADAVKPVEVAPLSATGAVSVADTKEPGQVVEGGEIYRAKCGKCHELKEPQIYNAAKWVKVVEWMAPRAKLDAAEKDNVTAYVSFHAKK
jgi:cytochrome c5